MPEENNQGQNAEEQSPAPAQAGTPDPQGNDSGETQGRTFTEAEVNAMITARLSKHEKALKTSWQKEQEEAKRKAELSAEERAKEAERKAAEIEAQAQAKINEAERRVQLAGKVKDVDYAIFKITQAGDEFLTSEGGVNVDAFLKAHPDHGFARPGPAPTSGAGRAATDKVDMNQLIREQITRSR